MASFESIVVGQMVLCWLVDLRSRVQGTGLKISVEAAMEWHAFSAVYPGLRREVVRWAYAFVRLADCPTLTVSCRDDDATAPWYATCAAGRLLRGMRWHGVCLSSLGFLIVSCLLTNSEVYVRFRLPEEINACRVHQHEAVPVVSSQRLCRLRRSAKHKH